MGAPPQEDKGTLEVVQAAARLVQAIKEENRKHRLDEQVSESVVRKRYEQIAEATGPSDLTMEEVRRKTYHDMLFLKNMLHRLKGEGEEPSQHNTSPIPQVSITPIPFVPRGDRPVRRRRRDRPLAAQGLHITTTPANTPLVIPPHTRSRAGSIYERSLEKDRREVKIAEADGRSGNAHEAWMTSRQASRYGM